MSKNIYRILFNLYENGNIVFIGESFDMDWIAYIDIACFLLLQDRDALKKAIEESGSLKLWVDELTAMELLRTHHRENSNQQDVKRIDVCSMLKASLEVH